MNFELLHKAHDILKAIPAQDIDLRSCVRKREECGSIACGIGWLALTNFHPDLEWNGELNQGMLLWQHEEVRFSVAAALLFDINVSQAQNLFASTYESSYDDLSTSSKLMLMRRFDCFFKEYEK